MASRIFSLALSAIENGISPRLRKRAWRSLYDFMARRWADTDWRFMNYGYMPDRVGSGTGARQRFDLAAADEPDRPFIGLYHHAIEGLPVDGARILEIGSGRGGGCSYIARYYRPGCVTGLDYSARGIELAKRLNPDLENLTYRQGDAEALPFPDAAFDVVLNIESSHCYADMARFVAEADRVLKPGGWFSWMDMRAAQAVAETDRQLADPGWSLERAMLLSPGVIDALDEADHRKVSRIRQIRLMRRFMLEFAGTRGSVLYRGLKSGDVVYFSRRFRKPTTGD